MMETNNQPLIERIKNRIAESARTMVTAGLPHTYYPAVGTREINRILDEEFAKTAVLAGQKASAWVVYMAKLSSLPNCNTCSRKKCDMKPKIGEICRINCFYWEGEER